MNALCWSSHYSTRVSSTNKIMYAKTVKALHSAGARSLLFEAKSESEAQLLWVGMNFSPAEGKYFSFPKGQYNTKLKAALEKSAFLAVILAAFSSRFYVTIPLPYVLSGFEHNIQNVWIVIFLKRGIVGIFSITVKFKFSFYITLLYFFSCKWVSVLWNIFLFF